MLLAAEASNRGFHAKLSQTRILYMVSGTVSLNVRETPERHMYAETCHALWGIQRMAESLWSTRLFCETMCDMKGLPLPTSKARRKMVQVLLQQYSGETITNQTAEGGIDTSASLALVKTLHETNQTFRVASTTPNDVDDVINIRIDPLVDKAISAHDFYLFVIKTMVLLASHDMTHSPPRTWFFEDRPMELDTTYVRDESSQADIKWRTLIHGLVATAIQLKNEGRFCEVNIYLVSQPDWQRHSVSALLKVARLSEATSEKDSVNSLNFTDVLGGTILPAEVA